jgi:5-carboxymethyl-2-hydroxymuconate isomerase
MPHLTFEYTDNLRADGDIPGLLKKANAALIAQGGVFPVGGIRSRAICHSEYCIADGDGDGDADYAFVHATLKIGFGRSEAEKNAACEDLFAMMKAHFAAIAAERYLALSLEIAEFSEADTWKQNNIHTRFRKA